MNIVILDAAAQDLLEGFRFYDKIQKGLGTYFIDSLFSDIDSLLVHYGTHPVYFGKFHRMLSKRFPFAIYYKVQDDTVCECTACSIAAGSQHGRESG